MQAGSYIEAMQNTENAVDKEIYVTEIAKTIRSLCKPSSILEAGVEEATTLAGILQHLDKEMKVMALI